MSNKRVLIAYPDYSFVKALETTFERFGFEVEAVTRVEDGSAIAERYGPSLVVIDLGLLEANRFEFCWNLRNNEVTRDVRILMVSNGYSCDSELLGLASGADDYLARPFTFDQLMHRVGILLKQQSKHPQLHCTPIRLDGLELDIDRRIARINGVDLPLTATEFRILWILAQNAGHVFDRSELVNESRGKDANCSVRTIDVHIRSIRRKLGKSRVLIQTVRGVGYRYGDNGVASFFEHENNPFSEVEDEFANPTESASASALSLV